MKKPGFFKFFIYGVLCAFLLFGYVKIFFVSAVILSVLWQSYFLIFYALIFDIANAPFYFSGSTLASTLYLPLSPALLAIAHLARFVKARLLWS